MPYCGRYGCPCCTCEKCGTYNGCRCEALAKKAEFIEKHKSTEDPDLTEAIDILEELN